MIDSWLSAAAAAGKWVLFIASGIFISIVVAMVICALRKGEPGDTDVTPVMQPFGPREVTGRTGIRAAKVGSKLKVLASRQTFITMESLLSGTASWQDWVFFLGMEVLFVCFWLIFLGIGLMYLPQSNGFSLFFPAISGLWLLGVFKAQWQDLNRARRKLSNSK